MLNNMGEVWNNRFGTYRFEAKRDKERFTVVCKCCRQNSKIGHFTLLFWRLREMYKRVCRTCSTIIFPLSTNDIIALWRCRCRSLRCFLNPLFCHACAAWRQCDLTSTRPPLGRRWVAFTRQTKVAKLKLACVKDTTAVDKLLATNRTSLCSRQLFHRLFRVCQL